MWRVPTSAKRPVHLIVMNGKIGMKEKNKQKMSTVKRTYLCEFGESPMMI